MRLVLLSRSTPRRDARVAAAGMVGLWTLACVAISIGFRVGRVVGLAMLTLSIPVGLFFASRAPFAGGRLRFPTMHHGSSRIEGHEHLLRLRAIPKGRLDNRGKTPTQFDQMRSSGWEPQLLNAAANSLRCLAVQKPTSRPVS